jgi:hypothetical protein
VIEAVFEASADRRNDFVSLTLQAMAATRLEKGCLLYRFIADLGHQNRFTLIDLWRLGIDALNRSLGFRVMFCGVQNVDGILRCLRGQVSIPASHLWITMTS